MQWGSMKTLIEQAKEELEILEYQQPNKFNSMKKELRAFISELESQNLPPKQSSTPSMSAATQESSNINKRKTDASVVEPGSIKRRCKTDAVLERAQQCVGSKNNAIFPLEFQHMNLQPFYLRLAKAFFMCAIAHEKYSSKFIIP